MILCSTLDRVKEKLEIPSATTTHDNLLRSILSGVSGTVESFLDRYTEEKARTEQYNAFDGQRTLFLRGYPVKTLTSIKNDTLREFTGDAIDSSYYYHEAARGIVSFDRYVPLYGPGVFQVVYTGGMAAVVERLIGVIGAVTGTMTVGNVASGGTSLARGTIRAITSAVSISLDVIAGQFIAGETLTDVTASGTCTLSSISQDPLISKFPDVVMAAEEQCEHVWQMRKKAGQVNVSADGTSVSFETPSLELISGVKAILARHRSPIPRR